jgi:hypothetical protein
MDGSTQAPKVLYKYLPPERIDILENMEVRFSPPTDFNDTFDADFLIPLHSDPSAFRNRSILRRRLGIICLTEEPDDHLMWVHYAKNLTGFALGFDTNAPFFRVDGRVLNKVSYQNIPYVTADPGMDVCFHKSKTWEHEREWRCVRYFERSDPRVVRIEPSLITNIIFGWKMEAWQIARIMLYATAHEMIPSTQFFVSSPSRKYWIFENKPKTVTLCDKCNGDGYLINDFSAAE